VKSQFAQKRKEAMKKQAEAKKTELMATNSKLAGSIRFKGRSSCLLPTSEEVIMN
jgi:hypothetical protein